jgi:hypothetical protein
MAIAIGSGHEPTSFLARRLSDGHQPLAKCDASDRLTRAIHRYVAGETGGRAFLVAGHRGAGKSTTVYNAIQECRRDAQRRHERYPLLVRLNGPQLLDPAMVIPPDTPPSTSSSDPKKPIEDRIKEDARPKSEARTFLSQIAMSLYKALSQEMIEQLRRRASARTRGWLPQEAELVASLQIELDDIPTEGRLRAFWSRLTALDGGMLGIKPPGPVRPSDQGMRELIALASAARAYREVIYDIHVSLDGKTEEQRRAELKSSEPTNGDATLSALAKALLGVATGGAVGGGAWAALHLQDISPLLAVAAGALTTIGFTYTRSASTTVTRSKSEVYERDPDKEASLGRILPDLIDRIQNAGLAPIFVVDELDKIPADDIDDHIQYLVDRAKLFVTDSAFFCYVVDRSYLELLKGRFLKGVYPKGYTFFTDVVHVAFTPPDLHQYLRGAMRVESRDAETADILRWILLHKSRMHALDLRRELEGIVVGNEDRLVRLSPQEVRSTRHGYDVQMQAIVELQLRDEALKARCDREPEFIRFAYDALYFASRRWETGEPTLDASEAAIKRYLTDRILHSEPRKSPKKAAADAESGADDGHADDLPLTERDLDFLIRHAQRVVEHLTSPSDLALLVADALPPHVVSMLPDKPLLSWEHGDVYRWAYDFSGLATDEEPLALETLDADLELVVGFAGVFGIAVP